MPYVSTLTTEITEITEVTGNLNTEVTEKS